MKKNKKEPAKVINRAQKTPNENNYSSRIVNSDKVIVQIPKSETEDKLTSMLTIGIMFALRQIGVKNLDITLKEGKSNYEIVVEK